MPNWTVESVQAPGQLVDTKKARVIAVIAGHGTPAATRTVSLVVNGNVIATKKVDVPADGRATVVFEGLDVPYGESRCAVRIERGWISERRCEQLCGEARRSGAGAVCASGVGRAVAAVLWRGAGGRGAGVVCVAADHAGGVSDIDPTKYAFVVLSDVPSVPSILEHTLMRNVEDGGSVLVAPGMADSHREHIPVYGGNVEDGHFYARGSAEERDSRRWARRMRRIQP